MTPDNLRTPEEIARETADKWWTSGGPIIDPELEKSKLIELIAQAIQKERESLRQSYEHDLENHRDLWPKKAIKEIQDLESRLTEDRQMFQRALDKVAEHRDSLQVRVKELEEERDRLKAQWQGTTAIITKGEMKPEDFAEYRFAKEQLASSTERVILLTEYLEQLLLDTIGFSVAFREDNECWDKHQDVGILYAKATVIKDKLRALNPQSTNPSREGETE